MAGRLPAAVYAVGVFGNGPMLTFYGFVPVALGGMGNNRGAVVAGLLLGLFQQTANFLLAASCRIGGCLHPSFSRFGAGPSARRERRV